MGQGALSKPAVQWWLSLNSSTIFNKTDLWPLEWPRGDGPGGGGGGGWWWSIAPRARVLAAVGRESVRSKRARGAVVRFGQAGARKSHTHL